MRDLKNNLETCALLLLKDRNLGGRAGGYDSELGEIHFTHKGKKLELPRKKEKEREKKKKMHGTFQAQNALEGKDNKVRESSGCLAGVGKAWRCPSGGLGAVCDHKM